MVVMPFGKYRGQPLCDIPEDYLCWCFGIARERLAREIAGEMWARGLLDRLGIPCQYCDGVAEDCCCRCGWAVCFRHVRQVGPRTAYCVEHWDHWMIDPADRPRRISERIVQAADANPDAYNRRRRRTAATAAP